MFCAECCVTMHEANPLHVIERWDGRRFKATSLRELGLRIQFGHRDCLKPKRRRDDFVVLAPGICAGTSTNTIIAWCELSLHSTHQPASDSDKLPPNPSGIPCTLTESNTSLPLERTTKHSPSHHSGPLFFMNNSSETTQNVNPGLDSLASSWETSQNANPGLDSLASS
ncbi:hypothetical protein C8J57DRAFT_1215789 [Mycena rebaudengoi]|nr:hypothetical protein C8J57DRAFT_1215789 [Mycena rebaudengoi]